MSSKVHIDKRVWEELRRKVKHVGKSYVKVGVLGSASKTEENGADIVEIAAIHEFGAPKAGIPERSYLRRTFRESQGRTELEKVTARLAKQLLANKTSLTEALQQLGAWAVGRVQRRIKQHIPPPLKPATVERKGSSTPLIDTGQLVNAITWEVVE